MSVASLLCDICGRTLGGSAILTPDADSAGVRLMLHPGDPKMKDDSVLVCVSCWRELGDTLKTAAADTCAACGTPVAYEASLHVLHMTGRIGEAPLWQLCRPHAVSFLNRFRFIDPKLQEHELALKADFPSE